MYRLNTIVKIAFVAAVLVFYLPLSVKGSVYNEKTILKFNQPVEIPGQVLDPGTYVFKLADSLSDRNIVQIWNKHQTHLYATLLAVPDYRLHPTGKTVVNFQERAAGAPEAIRAWFYPGLDYGQQFVYPKMRAAELAKLNNKPVPSMPTEMAANTKETAKSSTEALKKTPLKAEQPNGGEVALGQVIQKPPAQTAKEKSPVETAKNEAPAEPSRLPSTGSELFLVALAGVGALGLAAVLGLVSKRMV